MSLPRSRPAGHLALLLFGAGGHGRVVADAALAANEWTRILASDRDQLQCRGELLPSIALCEQSALERIDFAVHVAIGNNPAREREAGLWGLVRLVSVTHPSAAVSPFSHIGPGSFIAAQAVIAPGARLGLGVIVNHGAVVDHDTQVGDFSHIAPNATLGGNVSIGRLVLIGSGAVVLPSVQIGDGVVIGSGAVVTASITEAGTYTGIPARRVP